MCRRNPRTTATVAERPGITDDRAICVERAAATKRHVLSYNSAVGTSRAGNWILVSGGFAPARVVVAKPVSCYRCLTSSIRVHRPELRCRIKLLSFAITMKHNLISVRRPRRRLIILQRACQPYLITAVSIHHVDFFISIYPAPRQKISVVVGFLPRLHNTIARAHECELKGVSRPNRFLISKRFAGKCKPRLARAICVHYIDGRNSRMIALAGESDLRTVWGPRRLGIGRSAV